MIHFRDCEWGASVFPFYRGAAEMDGFVCAAAGLTSQIVLWDVDE
jgi:hypothetical protein